MEVCVFLERGIISILLSLLIIISEMCMVKTSVLEPNLEQFHIGIQW